MADGEVVRLDGVTRSFAAPGGQLTVLREVTLSLGRGAFVTVAGPSGSGKTTLLNLVGGLDRPTAGTVTTLGERIDRLEGAQLDRLRRRIGYVFQSFALLPSLSAYEQVELALRLSGALERSGWERRVRQCLRAVGLEQWRDHRPGELSGGQQQRVALARALAIRPALLLADEPTGDLDGKTAAQVCGLLRGLCEGEGMTVLVATHDPLVESFATARYTLADGRLRTAEAPALPV